MSRRFFIATLASSGALCSLCAALACGGSHSNHDGASNDGSVNQHPAGDGALPGDDGGIDTSDDGGASSDDGGTGTHAGTEGGSQTANDGGPQVVAPFDAGEFADGGYPSGWLYTTGGTIYESNGNGTGTQWMGRGVNVDDIFFCGYNNTLWMTNPGTTLEQMISFLMTNWKPSFVRISLSMDSDTEVSWFSDPSQYATPMTAVINDLGSYAGVHVLVTLRSDGSMVGEDMASGYKDPEATGIPSSAATTPNASKYPTGTDALYVALVDTFAGSGSVMFGLTNEPGGNTLSNATIASAMNHAVGVIRAEENRLGVPHHIVSVQGNSWTSSIKFYSEPSSDTFPDGGTGPVITYDNVVYEVHGYPPAASSYTYSNIPVIIGEYGSLPANDAGTDPAFFNDLETKKIPSLAWDFDSYNNCAPDLVNANQSTTNITATAGWGTMVQAYLLAHAQ
jgi:hypothetical protein